jgi:luciferase family oxidoreductase group 1
MISLSVLDQSPVRSGGTPADTFAETVRLAQAAERLGYRRYWLAEHHGSEDFAGSAPEIMITRVAAATSKIRVGSGGVMLSHYSPFKVAETFRVLETLYPGRIDLGIGRAPGADHLTSVALAYGSPIGVEYFPTKIADLTAFLTGGKPATEALAPVHVNPRGETAPEVWLLGSSDESARYAAHFGLSFSFAQFISPLGGEAVLDAYRRDFRPSPLLPAPRTSIGVFVICADTEAEARRLGRSRDLWRLRIDRGERKPYPSVEEAEAYPYAPQELAHIERNRRRSFFGAPEQIKAQLGELAAQFGVEELVILTITHDPAARLRSYELLAQAFALTPRG